jgi:LytS/YehU family sensor histidine kinase
VIYVVRTGLNWWLVTENIWPEAIGEQKAFSFDHIVAVVIGELYVVSFATAIKLTVDWIYERRRVEKWRQATIKSELNFLKSQIQPHFFFNTLNNLYALTLEKSDAAPSVVLKLSDIMQYVLYDVRESHIRLYDEINYIQNYLDLERLRYGNRIRANTDIAGAVDDIMVPPLLFLPFIENCFKHGTTAEDDIIEIDISFEIMKNKILKFRVANSYNPGTDISMVHGIGIKNVKRRLELMYKDRFKLTTQLKDQKYRVELKIPIQ